MAYTTSEYVIPSVFNLEPIVANITFKLLFYIIVRHIGYLIILRDLNVLGTFTDIISYY